MAIKNFVDWYHWASSRFDTTQMIPAYALVYILYGAIVFSIPFFLSWFLSRKQQENRIVPPLFMQAIALGLLLFFVYNSSITSMEYAWILLYGIYAGLIQDGIITGSLGKTVVAADIIRYSLLIHSNMVKTRETVMSEQFKNTLRLKKTVKDTWAHPHLKLRTQKGRGYQTILELKETENADETIINLAIYQEQRYFIKHIEKTDDIYEFAKMRIDWIRDYFARHCSVQVDEASSDNAQSLMNFVLDDLQGTLTHLQQMSTETRIIVFATIALLIAGVVSSIFVNVEIGILVLLTAIGFGIEAISRGRA